MILVIADDLSGAAELAGVAHAMGYTAEVQTDFLAEVPSQVVCVDSGGRSLSPGEAAEGMERLMPEAIAGHPEWIYLKFDSVLRGNVLAELLAAMRVAGVQSIVLVTANPGRGRTIRDGSYFIGGVPLHLTSFAADPEHPRTTSTVRELLGWPADAIATPDAGSSTDLEQLARMAGRDFLLAGAAEFFEALLLERNAGLPGNRSVTMGRPRPAPKAPGNVPLSPARKLDRVRPATLVVCGSKTSWQSRREEASIRGVPVFDIGDDPVVISRALSENEAVLLGIGDLLDVGASSAPEPIAALAEIVSTVVGTARPGRLLLEGGATAAAVVRRQGWTRLVALDGVGGGVGCLSPIAPDAPTVLIKPGSYPWPNGLW